MSYVAGFDENTLTTRSWDPPTPYVLYGETDKAIGIAFTKNDEEPKPGYFFTSSGKWRTNIDDIEANTTYYLYGYVPHFGGISMSITDRNGVNANYSEGAKVTLNDVPAVMPSDLCVVIGAKNGTDKETVTGLRKGYFAYQESASAESNFVFLLFDHLYAALRIRMRVHDDYAALRTIKLKSLSLKTYAGETTSSQKTNIEVSLEATDGSNPIQDITYASSGGEITEPLEFWSSEGELLTTAFKSFVGHFMPDGITTLVLTSVYDVYDTQGNLIRKDCKATNTMKLSELLTGQVTTRRGSRYTINMTIKPTYLYMLSEPDLDNPTVTVE
jgi:archaellin